MVSLLSIADKMISLGEKIRPLWLKRLKLSFLFHFLSYGFRLQSLFSQLRLSVSLVSGPEVQTGDTIHLLFVGGRKFPVSLGDLIFREKPLIHHQENIFFWRIKELKKRYSDQVDAVLVSCDQFYQRFLHQDDFLVFPHMIDMVLVTSKSLHELLKALPHSAQEDVRKIQKEQFSFEIKSDRDTLDRFYHDMYRPMLKNRIGETDVFTADLVLFRILRELGYQLMMITYKGNEVFGVFFKKQNDTLLLKYAGVLQGDIDLIKKGASSAFYYFFIVYAKDQNVNILDFGGARPFFNDGLFQYKLKWGMTVKPYDPVKDVFGIQIVTERKPLKQFLIHNPFIGLNEKNELIGFVFVDKKTITDTLRNQFEKRFQTPGVNEVRFIKL